MNALGAVGEGLVELALTPESTEARLGVSGDAANVCVMAARLGLRARIAGRVGHDPLGERLVRFWAKQGLELDAVRRDPAAPTGMYVNEPGPNGGHRFSYWRTGSAGSRLQATDLPDSWFDDLGVLVVTGVTLAVSASSAEAAARAIKLARTRGIPVACVLNHRAALGGGIEQLAGLARASNIVIGSLDEANAVFGTTDWAGLRTVLRPGPSELALTDGDRPAVVVDGSRATQQDVPAVAVRNAAGAGDAFAGAYLASRLLGRSPTASLAWAVAAASLSVQEHGCAASYPDLEQTASVVPGLPPPERLDAAPVRER